MAEATVTPRRDRSKRPKLGGSVICVEVGQGASLAKFFVHTELATKHSEFFQGALKHGFKEAKERVVRLPEQSSAAFDDFHSFLYTGKVYTGDRNERFPPDFDEEWARLSRGWLLGEVLLSGAYKDAIADAILHKAITKDAVPTTMYFEIYPKSREGSPFRKLLVDLAIHWADDLSPKQHFADGDEGVAAALGYFQDVAIALHDLYKSREKVTPTSLLKKDGNCLYHEHGEEKPCYKTLFN